MEQRSPQVLAAFILTLIHEPNGIGSYVHAFTRADDLNAATEIVKGEIDCLCAHKEWHTTPVGCAAVIADRDQRELPGSR